MKIFFHNVKHLFITLFAPSVFAFLIGDSLVDRGYVTIEEDASATFEENTSAFDYKNNRWFVVYEKDGKIYGRFFGLDKNLSPALPILISSSGSNPDITF
mgnify:CR=1 FL=1